MTKSKRATASDLKKVDAHLVRAHEYDDAPELTNEQLTRAVVSIGLRPPGRPKSESKKTAVSLRLDADVVAAFRKTGIGWQTRINDTLRANLKGGKVTLAPDKKLKSRATPAGTAGRKRA